MAMTPEEKRLKQREWSRAWRQRNLEQYRAAAREAMRAKRAAEPTSNAEACGRYYRRHRSEIATQRAERRQGDPAFREADNERRLGHHYANRDEANVKRTRNGQLARIASPWAKFFHSAQQRAKKKGVPFSLTREWVKEHWTGRCEVTDIPFSTSKTTRGPGFFSPSIDRIIPERGYVPENCRFVLWAVNALKSGGTDEDMLLVAKAIVQKSRKISRA